MRTFNQEIAMTDLGNQAVRRNQPPRPLSTIIHNNQPASALGLITGVLFAAFLLSAVSTALVVTSAFVPAIFPALIPLAAIMVISAAISMITSACLIDHPPSTYENRNNFYSSPAHIFGLGGVESSLGFYHHLHRF